MARASLSSRDPPAFAGDREENGAKRLRLRRQERGIDIGEDALPRQDEAGTRQTQDVAERGEKARSPRHSFQPLWIATMPPLSRRTEVRAKPASRMRASNSSGVGKVRIDSAR